MTQKIIWLGLQNPKISLEYIRILSKILSASSLKDIKIFFIKYLGLYKGLSCRIAIPSKL